MTRKNSALFSATLCATLLAAGAAQASFTLTFEGLQDDEPIGSYYAGGIGGFGSGPGPNFGVVFSDNGLALIDADNGGFGNFANEPSPNTIMYFLAGNPIYMNVPAGFDTGFSFYYSSSDEASISVFDGVDGAGNVLASFLLPANYQDGGCQGDPTGDFCHWDPVGTTFAGTAKSIGFGGEINYVGFDNVTFGRASPDPIPEPGALVLVGLGLGLAGFSVHRRRRA